MVAMFKILDEDELEMIKSDADAVEELLFPEDVDDPFEGQHGLDKSWHSLHYLLTGSAEPDGTPAGDAILGGTPVGGDLGYGPARLIDHQQVLRVAAALQEADLAAAYANLDRAAASAAKLYCGFEFSQDEQEYLRGYFDTLLEVYSTAAADGTAVLAYLV
ncbi:MAG: YfbM family protein [Pseudomonadota bacterium]